MRRKDREITDFEQVKEIIEKGEVCRIAINDEYPYVVPLNYGVEKNGDEVTLYFHSATEGRKIDLIRKNPKVGFEIELGHELTYDGEKGSCSMLYECVMGNGIIEFTDNDEEKMKALKLILTHYGRDCEGFNFVPALLDRTITFKIVCHNLTGKKH